MPRSESSVPRYGLVIFDFDGTLADSGMWFLDILDELSDRFKFRKVREEEIEIFRGMSSRDVISAVKIPFWKLPAMSKYVRARLAGEIEKIALFDGIGTAIHALADAGVRLAVVSSNSVENVHAVLGADLVARIERFECGTSLFGKDARFKRIVKDSGLPRDAILAIGDETRDISAARKVGIHAGAVLWGYASETVLTGMGPDVRLTVPADILTAVLGAQVAQAA
jgi:phosphoglycolate phosphatase